jgi:hypothetical protein
VHTQAQEEEELKRIKAQRVKHTYIRTHARTHTHTHTHGTCARGRRAETHRGAEHLRHTYMHTHTHTHTHTTQAQEEEELKRIEEQRLKELDALELQKVQDQIMGRASANTNTQELLISKNASLLGTSESPEAAGATGKKKKSKKNKEMVLGAGDEDAAKTDTTAAEDSARMDEAGFAVFSKKKKKEKKPSETDMAGDDTMKTIGVGVQKKKKKDKVKQETGVGMETALPNGWDMDALEDDEDDDLRRVMQESIQVCVWMMICVG